MKTNPLKLFLAFLALSSVLQLAAQQSEADRKLLADIRAKAERGDAQSQDELGGAFNDGRLGVVRDYVTAVNWYRKAAEQNYVDAQYNLATFYAEGKGVAQNADEAVKWFRKAAEQGMEPAQGRLGRIYFNGEGVPKDLSEALKWFRKANKNPHTPESALDWETPYYLGQMYAKGEGVSKDPAEAVRQFRQIPYCIEAQVALWDLYSKGEAVPLDSTEALDWTEAAANKNISQAIAKLADMYATGEGVAKNIDEAQKRYFWAAVETTNIHERFELYRKGAELGGVFFYGLVAESYLSGDGVAKDSAQAVKWYRKGAEQNERFAQFGLGFCYAQGRGVIKDEIQALKWWRKSAEQCYSKAQFQLVYCYFNGLGATKDYVEAYKWALLAAGQGYKEAKTAVTTLEARLTSQQIAEGQTLARNFKPRQVPSPGSDTSATSIEQTRPESSGTGFFITDDGYLITNEHVAGNGAQVRLVTGAGLISAKVVKVDSANDLALLKANGTFTPLTIASSRTMRMGSTVATVGFPNIGLQGFAPKLARGEIAALSGVQDDPRYFQISVPVQPGNSGGALVDERGNVVGVVAAKLSAQAALATSGSLPENVNYAVKSSLLLSFLESVPDVAAKLKDPETKECRFEDAVKSAEKAAVLVLVY